MSVYKVYFKKRKKITPAICLGCFDIKRFSESNFVIAYMESDINPFTNRREIMMKRFSDYKLKRNRLIIYYSYWLKPTDSEREYVRGLLEKRLNKS